MGISAPRKRAGCVMFGTSKFEGPPSRIRMRRWGEETARREAITQADVPPEGELEVGRMRDMRVGIYRLQLLCQILGDRGGRVVWRGMFGCGRWM